MSLVDLPARVRTNNFAEISSVNDQTTFSEDRYVFQFIEYSGIDKTLLTIYIDGLYYIPDESFSEDGVRYIYIPTTLITSDTLMETNVDALYSFVSRYQFPNITQYVEFNCNNSDKAVMGCDIYLINESLNLYVDKADYDVYVNDDFGNIISIGSNTARAIHDKFYIKLLDPNQIGNVIAVRINKIGHTLNWVIGNNIGGFIYPVQVNNDPNYFKIYKDGRLIPTDLYVVTVSNVFNTMFYIDISVNKIPGDIYKVQYTSNKFTPLLFLETIPTNGIIDVGDTLDRPFDYHTYEYYLNGRKLNYTNIEIMTPHTLLVKDVHSRQNFEILSRNMDDSQFFVYGNALTDINSSIYNLAEFQSVVIGNLPVIPDTEPSIVQILDPNGIILVSLFTEYLTTLEFINPDIDQITPQALIDYAPVLTAPYLLNPDADDHGSGTNDLQKLFMNPDVDIN
jgi:hypothetical protein